MIFQDVKEFLESWGLHFDTQGGESSTIPYPAVYHRVCVDAAQVGGELLSKFVSRITDTTEGETYLTADSWEEIEEVWNKNSGGV